MKHSLAVAVLTIFVSLALFAQTLDNGQALAQWASLHKARPAGHERQTKLSGRVAPELRIARWLNVAGDPQLRGKVVLVDFWAMSCVPCIKSFPKIAAMGERFRERGFAIVTIHPSTAGVRSKGIAGNDVWVAQPAERLLPDFLAARGMRLPVGVDAREATARAYALDATPAYFLVDRDGIVRYESHELPTDADIDHSLSTAMP